MLVRYLVAAALCAGMAMAQAGEEMGSGMGGRGGGGGSRGGGGMGEGMGSPTTGMPRRQSKAEMFADKLKLKNDQKEEAQRILNAAMEKAGPVREALAKGRQVIGQAMLGKASDEDIKKLLGQYATLNAQMTGIEAEAFGKVYALLKPNQQPKAAQAFELLSGMFSGGMGGGGGAGRGRGNRGGGE